MWYVALTIGIFGSLHCVGMCGPLAIAFSQRDDHSMGQNLASALAYNLGRTATYALLGLLFGTLGSFLFLADLQKVLSILLGVVLVLSFLLSIDLDKSLNGTSLAQQYFFKVKSLLSRVMDRSKDYPPYMVGMANGLLPCGLVYLALAGALSTGSLAQGMLFMTFFGLGTIPMMAALSTGMAVFPVPWRLRFRKILPYVTLTFGVFLIYRGVVVDMPTELNFWEALKNPVMCH